MEKRTILAAVVAEMRNELALLNRAADDARSGATDSEVQSESKYDTRGLESSYLARGHAMKFEALAADVAVLEGLDLTDHKSGDPIVVGTLVGVDMGGETMLFLVLPKGGGIEVEVDGVKGEITVVTPESPMGGRLMGLKEGDTFSLNKGQAASKVVSTD